MQAVILIGHGSLRSASGAAMIRIAARLRTQGVAPVVEAAFLNYSRPTLAETVEKCRSLGVTRIVVQPYFLIAGAYVMHDLPQLLAGVAARYPELSFDMADALCDHPSMLALAIKRAGAVLRPADHRASCGLLLMAHGTPLETANAPLYGILHGVQHALGLSTGRVGYLDCNQPGILAAADQLIAEGAKRIVALPYFLHLGRHVREDLPALVQQAQAAHPEIAVVTARHLGYDLLLVSAVAERAEAVMAAKQTGIAEPRVEHVS